MVSFGSPNEKRSTFTLLIVFAWVAQSIGRIVFALYGTPQGMGQFLDKPTSYDISYILFFMFLTLGLVGLASAIGYWLKLTWGLKAMLLTSIVSIGFDAWGCTLQFTAVLGMFVPMLVLIFLSEQKRSTAHRITVDNQKRT